MELDFVRQELDQYDAAIRNLLVLRMSLIPIVTDIKIRNHLPFYQAKREDEIYRKLEIFAKENGMAENLLKDVYKIIMATALQMEEDMAENAGDSILREAAGTVPLSSMQESFTKLDAILKEELPAIISEIQNSLELENLPLLDKATLYYHEKIAHAHEREEAEGRIV